MTEGPLDRWHDLVPREVAAVVDRDSPIPSIAQQAAVVQAGNAALVRADIGQIAGVDPELEVHYGPPVGLEPMRQAIADTWNHVYGLDLGARNVAVTTGAAEALALLFRCFASGRTVGLPRGHWENYVNGAQLGGGDITLVEYFDGEGRLDVDGVRRQIRDKDVSVLLVNFPCNPTGAVLEADEARALAEAAREADVLVIADEVYARLRFDGVAPQTMVAHAPERVVAVSSASKEYLLPGARVGYVVCDREAITDQVLRKLTRANTASPNVLGQRRLIDLLRDDLEDMKGGRPPRVLSRVLDAMRDRRDALVEVLDRHGFGRVGRPGHEPAGTIFLMAALPSWWSGDDAAFSAAALEAACVSVIPGSSFGIPGAVRFSFGGMTPDAILQLDENLARFRQNLGGPAAP